jgi:hypothetical protein
LRWAIVAVAKTDMVNREERDARDGMAGLDRNGAGGGGAFGLGYCIVAAISAKRAGCPTRNCADGWRKIVSINVGALLVSVLGLMSVVVGVFLA